MAKKTISRLIAEDARLRKLRERKSERLAQKWQWPKPVVIVGETAPYRHRPGTARRVGDFTILATPSEGRIRRELWLGWLAPISRRVFQEVRGEEVERESRAVTWHRQGSAPAAKQKTPPDLYAVIHREPGVPTSEVTPLLPETWRTRPVSVQKQKPTKDPLREFRAAGQARAMRNAIRKSRRR